MYMVARFLRFALCCVSFWFVFFYLSFNIKGRQRGLRFSVFVFTIIIVVIFHPTQFQMNPTKPSFDMTIRYSYRDECTLNTNQLQCRFVIKIQPKILTAIVTNEQKLFVLHSLPLLYSTSSNRFLFLSQTLYQVVGIRVHSFTCNCRRANETITWQCLAKLNPTVAFVINIQPENLDS